MSHIPAALVVALFFACVVTVRAIPPNQQLGNGHSRLYMPLQSGETDRMDAHATARGAQEDKSEGVTHRIPLASFTGSVQAIVTAVGGEQRVWPELVGVSYEEARGVLAASGKQPQMVPQGNVVTADYRQDRVRVYVDEEEVVIAAPRIG